MYEPSSNLSQKRNSSRDLENERSRILCERQKEQILAEVRSEIQKHELQVDGQGVGVPKAGRQQAGGGLARVPNLRACKHLCSWSGARRRGRMN